MTLGEGKAVLGLSRTDGLAFDLHLEGVDALAVDDLRAGNIILWLWIVSSTHPEAAARFSEEEMADALDRLFPGPHSTAAAPYHEQHRLFLDRKRRAIEKGEASLVMITPAYGADLAAYCASVTLTPRNQPPLDSDAPLTAPQPPV